MNKATFIAANNCLNTNSGFIDVSPLLAENLIHLLKKKHKPKTLTSYENG